MRPERLAIFHMDLNFVCLKEDYIREWLSKLAAMGYNAILWEMEDKVRWETCPECVWPEAFDKERFKALLGYSSRLGMENIPLLQVFGHAEYVLLKEKYHSFRELPDQYDCYCTSKPEVRAFLSDWIVEIVELFGEDFKYFHLGGDEAYHFAQCPICAERADKYGKNKLYSEHLFELSAPLLEKGIRPGVWCDMILHYPEEMKDVPKEYVIWDWNYWEQNNAPEKAHVWGKGFFEKDEIPKEDLEKTPEIVDDDGALRSFYKVDVLKRMGFDVILCGASRSAGDSFFCPRFDVHPGNLIGMARKAAETGILGWCVTSWAIRLNQYETQEPLFLLPFESEMNLGESQDDILRSAADKFFGVESSECVQALKDISSKFAFITHECSGVQWSRFKDSLPAPPKHLEKKLAIMKEKGDFERVKEETRNALRRISIGIKGLEDFRRKAKTGGEFIDVCLEAAKFQQEFANCAVAILNGEIGERDVENLRDLKQRFESFQERVETPRSAAKNAGLVFDHLIEYVEFLHHFLSI